MDSLIDPVSALQGCVRVCTGGAAARWLMCERQGGVASQKLRARSGSCISSGYFHMSVQMRGLPCVVVVLVCATVVCESVCQPTGHVKMITLPPCPSWTYVPAPFHTRQAYYAFLRGEIPVNEKDVCDLGSAGNRKYVQPSLLSITSARNYNPQWQNSILEKRCEVRASLSRGRATFVWLHSMN